jgi:hypothetical protein
MRRASEKNKPMPPPQLLQTHSRLAPMPNAETGKLSTHPYCMHDDKPTAAKVAAVGRDTKSTHAQWH